MNLGGGTQTYSPQHSVRVKEYIWSMWFRRVKVAGTEAGSTNLLLITGFYFRGGFAMDWLMEDPSIRGERLWRWMVLDISCAPLQILLEQLWDTFHKLPVMTLRPEPQLPVSGPTRRCKLAVYFLFLCCFPVSITFSFWHCFLNKLYSLKHLSQEILGGKLLLRHLL